MKRHFILGLLLVSAIMLMVGCSDDKTNPLAAFEPEIVNNADAFQFQISDAENVTTTVEYTWENENTTATINHSSVVTDGEAAVTIYAADGTIVYTNGLVASLNESSQTGVAGNWKVRVTLVNLSGTLNFRVEKG